jgi:RNA polymerase sigma-70 factor (ECF subfamily)
MTAAEPLPPADASQAIDWARKLAEHEAWVRRVIAARTGEPSAVDEVWQQVALAAIEQRWPLTDPDKVGPWLHRLAVIAAARYCRAAGRGRRMTSKLAELQAIQGSPAASDPLALLMRRERLALVRQAMDCLAPRDAEMLQLKYGERWSYRQIAEKLGVTEKAVDCRLLRARAQLRGELARLGIGGDEQ